VALDYLVGPGEVDPGVADRGVPPSGLEAFLVEVHDARLSTLDIEWPPQYPYPSPQLRKRRTLVNEYTECGLSRRARLNDHAFMTARVLACDPPFPCQRLQPASQPF
jgi:hypothetical protein